MHNCPFLLLLIIRFSSDLKSHPPSSCPIQAHHPCALPIAPALFTPIDNITHFFGRAFPVWLSQDRSGRPCRVFRRQSPGSPRRLALFPTFSPPLFSIQPFPWLPVDPRLKLAARVAGHSAIYRGMLFPRYPGRRSPSHLEKFTLLADSRAAEPSLAEHFPSFPEPLFFFVEVLRTCLGPRFFDVPSTVCPSGLRWRFSPLSRR